jgi:DNA-directed RNA polymerase specialized sigma24 family protein
VVLAAGNTGSPNAQEALETLCRRYWYPLYAYVRHQGFGPQDAEDLTQDFFAVFLEKGYLDRADPGRGRFRTFLLASIRNFLRNARDRLAAQKRGCGQRPISWDSGLGETRYLAEPVERASPDQIYAKRWAGTLLRHVLDWLREDFRCTGRDELFDQLKSHLWGEEDAVPYARLGTELGMTPVALKVTVYRLRQRFRLRLREEIAHTVGDPTEVDDEIGYLMRVFSQ